MLKTGYDADLRRTLDFLSIPDGADGSTGYYPVASAAEAERARSQGKFVNVLGEGMIVADQEVRLGKRHIDYCGDRNQIEYFSIDDWEVIRAAFQHISGLDAVPRSWFPRKRIMIQEYVKGETLFNTAEVHDEHRRLFLDFVVQMNRLGFAHRDLHCKNIILGSSTVYVIDWDFVTSNPVPLLEAYDLTGRGLPSPHHTGYAHIFRVYPTVGVRSVADLMGFTLEDLIAAS